MAPEPNAEETNAQAVAEAIQEQEATEESNDPKARVNLVIIAYPVVLVIVALLVAAYYGLVSSGLNESVPAPRNPTPVNSPLESSTPSS